VSDAKFWSQVDTLNAQPGALPKQFVAQVQVDQDEISKKVTSWKWSYMYDLHPAIHEELTDLPDIQVDITSTPDGPQKMRVVTNIDEKGHFRSGYAQKQLHTQKSLTKLIPQIFTQDLGKLALNSSNDGVSNDTSNQQTTGVSAVVRADFTGYVDATLISGFAYPQEATAAPGKIGKIVVTPDCNDSTDARNDAGYGFTVNAYYRNRRITDLDLKSLTTQAVNAELGRFAADRTLSGEISIEKAKSVDNSITDEAAKDKATTALDQSLAYRAVYDALEKNGDSNKLAGAISNKALQNSVVLFLKGFENVTAHGTQDQKDNAQLNGQNLADAYSAEAFTASDVLTQVDTTAVLGIKDICNKDAA
jgi:hypothetical protein